MTLANITELLLWARHCTFNPTPRDRGTAVIRTFQGDEAACWVVQSLSGSIWPQTGSPASPSVLPSTMLHSGVIPTAQTSKALFGKLVACQ